MDHLDWWSDANLLSSTLSSISGLLIAKPLIYNMKGLPPIGASAPSYAIVVGTENERLG